MSEPGMGMIEHKVDVSPCGGLLLFALKGKASEIVKGRREKLNIL